MKAFDNLLFNKKTAGSVMIMLLVVFCAKAQDSAFTFLEHRESDGLCILQSRYDNHYYAGGSVIHKKGGSTYAHLAKLNTKGDTVWTKTFTSKKGDQRDKFEDILQVNSKMLAVAGCMDDRGIAMGIDTSGKEVWNYIDSADCRFTSICMRKDGGYFLGGYLDYEYIYIVRLSAKGKKIWSKKLDYGKQDRVYTIALMPDQGIVINAWYSSTTLSDKTPCVIRMNENGNVIWKTDFQSISVGYLFDMKTDAEGNAYLTGDTQGSSLPVIVKLDAKGKVLWRTIYNGAAGYFRGYGIALTKDSGCVITGRTTKGEGYLLKTDKDGNEQWRLILSPKTMLKDVMETKDGCFVVTGTSDAATKNSYKVIAYGEKDLRVLSVMCVFKVKPLKN